MIKKILGHDFIVIKYRHIIYLHPVDKIYFYLKCHSYGEIFDEIKRIYVYRTIDGNHGMIIQRKDDISFIISYKFRKRQNVMFYITKNNLKVVI